MAHSQEAARDVERRQPGRGRDANAPSEIPPKGWKDILWRVYRSVTEDRLLLVAAGASFYLLLALFPALAAFVSLYGFVADPATIADHVAFLGGLLPKGGLDIITGQLESLASRDDRAFWGFISGFAIALWSANAGVKGLFEGLNVAYGESEKRSFLWLNLVSLLFTVGVLLVGVMMLVSVGVVPALLALLRLDHMTETLVAFLRWPLLMVIVMIGLSLVYRFGPSREDAKWRWIGWGSALAAVVWLAASWGFSFYLQNFADYNATYGSLGAIIGLMMWTWISVVITLIGAEINAEMEHQTVRDSTTGPPKPIGERGAQMADTIGKAADDTGS